ncbi:hypothetical protein FDP41_003283 [Naegleria fowleri]|uniref:Spc7 kinetochore protein domain-containing protein n=1 Tax=Naegleria fowleri TaxID=5763 RepID=A0A6A5BU87_NAEFO|nr:uncharacterized protein FDP41_003283 [Naegleria fowleri]KAF0977961.1 hypothetical protein FDP41_003283 [Naegleria fowleri]CAG4708992.1 unnamed protein product [Naegleria fowleri]
MKRKGIHSSSNGNGRKTLSSVAAASSSSSAMNSSTLSSPPIKQDKKRVRRVSFSTKQPDIQMFEPAKSPTQLKARSKTASTTSSNMMANGKQQVLSQQQDDHSEDKENAINFTLFANQTATQPPSSTSSLGKSIFDDDDDEDDQVDALHPKQSISTMEFTHEFANEPVTNEDEQTMEFTQLIPTNISVLENELTNMSLSSASHSTMLNSGKNNPTNSNSSSSIQSKKSYKPNLVIPVHGDSSRLEDHGGDAFNDFNFDPTPAPAIPDSSFLFGSVEVDEDGNEVMMMDQSILNQSQLSNGGANSNERDHEEQPQEHHEEQHFQTTTALNGGGSSLQTTSSNNVLQELQPQQQQRSALNQHEPSSLDLIPQQAMTFDNFNNNNSSSLMKVTDFASIFSNLNSKSLLNTSAHDMSMTTLFDHVDEVPPLDEDTTRTITAQNITGELAGQDPTKNANPSTMTGVSTSVNDPAISNALASNLNSTSMNNSVLLSSVASTLGKMTKYSIADFWSHMSIRFLTTITDRKSMVPPQNARNASRFQDVESIQNEELSSEYRKIVVRNESLDRMIENTKKKIERIEKDISEKETYLSYHEPVVVHSAMSKTKNLDIPNNVRISLQSAKNGANVEKFKLKSETENLKRQLLIDEIYGLDEQLQVLDKYARHYEYLISNLQSEIQNKKDAKKKAAQPQSQPHLQSQPQQSQSQQTQQTSSRQSSQSSNMALVPNNSSQPQQVVTAINLPSTSIAPTTTTSTTTRRRQKSERLSLSAQDLLISNPNLLSLVKNKFVPYSVNRKHHNLVFEFPKFCDAADYQKPLTVDIKFNPLDKSIVNVKIVPCSSSISSQNNNMDEIEHALFKLIEMHIVTIIKRFSYTRYLPIIVSIMSSQFQFLYLFMKEIRILRSRGIDVGFDHIYPLLLFTSCQIHENESGHHSLELKAKHEQHQLLMNITCRDGSFELAWTDPRNEDQLLDRFVYDCNLLKRVRSLIRKCEQQ